MQNGQPLQQIPGSNQRGGQFMQQQQQQQQQQMLSQMQQDKQSQQQLQQLQQQLNLSQTTGNILQPTNNSLASLQQQNVGLQQGLGAAASLQPAGAPTSQAMSGAALPSNSTGSLGQSSLTALQQNGVGPSCSWDVQFVSGLAEFYASLFQFYNASSPLLNLFAAIRDGEHAATEHGECFAICWRQCTECSEQFSTK